jgi:hypothetical protein
MKFRFNRSHHSQPDRWSYTVPDGPVFSADRPGAPGLDELIEKLSKFRRANGLPPGDPEHDIAITYAVRYPWLVRSEDSVGSPESIAEEAEMWLNRMWRSAPLQLVEARARDERFDRCLRCPYFEPTDWASDAPDAARKLFILNPAKPRDDHGWCVAYGVVPSVFVQLLTPSQHADTTDPAKGCWITDPPKQE